MIRNAGERNGKEVCRAIHAKQYRDKKKRAYQSGLVRNVRTKKEVGIRRPHQVNYERGKGGLYPTCGSAHTAEIVLRRKDYKVNLGAEFRGEGKKRRRTDEKTPTSIARERRKSHLGKRGKKYWMRGAQSGVKQSCEEKKTLDKMTVTMTAFSQKRGGRSRLDGPFSGHVRGFQLGKATSFWGGGSGPGGKTSVRRRQIFQCTGGGGTENGQEVSGGSPGGPEGKPVKDTAIFLGVRQGTGSVTNKKRRPANSGFELHEKRAKRYAIYTPDDDQGINT